ncbi:MAG: site-specific DNA-methyltransferase [Candidatus Sumerlaeia bacterium]|nr:site-specific DNA-methyltransferase [Candidatus Sumerlaeia bacterium]
MKADELRSEFQRFSEFGRSTVVSCTESLEPSGRTVRVETYTNEFWTAKQRAAHSLHEISYRACFKPQLPHFFIERLTRRGDVVYDPFMGRGTTLLEAALMERIPMGCDANPLSLILVAPRLNPPSLQQIATRLREINFCDWDEFPRDLLVFYHPKTLEMICALKKYLLARRASGNADFVDAWIQMVAVNRLTGHSSGFFSVYTLPPNQAVSVSAQKKINAERRQKPPFRDVPSIILRKSRMLLADCDPETRAILKKHSQRAILLTQPAAHTPEIPDNSVHLVVTSPPFLDVVDYAQDNWLRCWFCGIDPEKVPITVTKRLDAWQSAMKEVFCEIARVLVRGGHVAFEVGEVRNGKVKLEEMVLPCGIAAGLEPVFVLINDQQFTKTSHCWGVSNQEKGTNTNRVVVFKRR